MFLYFPLLTFIHILLNTIYTVSVLFIVAYYWLFIFLYKYVFTASDIITIKL